MLPGQSGLRKMSINVIVQLGLKRHPDMNPAPLVMDFARNDSDRGVLELIFSRQDMGYPVVAPPGVPPERVAILRKAFEAVLKDPEYLADAKKQHLEAEFMRGEEVEALIKRAHGQPSRRHRARQEGDRGRQGE